MRRLSPAGRSMMRRLTRSTWDESKHPRDPGGEGGGQFIKKGSVGVDEGKKKRDDEERKIEELIARAEADPRVIEAERMIAERGDARDDPGVRNPDGTYTESGRAENRRIANSFLDDKAKPAFGQRPVATIVIGKPGAGKTTMLENPEVSKTIPYSVTVNPDMIKERIPGFSNRDASAYHERSSDIASQELIPKVIEGRYNVVFDASGKNPRKMEEMVRSLKKLDYEVNVLWADTDNLTAAERVYERFLKGGRYMPVRLAARDYRSGPGQSYEIMKHTGLADNWARYDTSTRELRRLEASARAASGKATYGSGK